MDRNSVKKIIIPLLIKEIDFNSAQFNRVRSLYKNIISNQLSVEILVLRSNSNRSELIDNINVIYFNNQSKGKKSAEISYLFIKEFLEKQAPENKVFLCVPIWHNAHNFKLIKWSIKKGIVCCQERSEYPFIGCNFRSFSGLKKQFDLFLYKKKILPQLDFMIIMTNNLIEYYSKFTECKVIHIPMTVDFNRFGNTVKDIVKTKYLAYCGTMNCKKDGVDILVEAFAKLAAQVDDIELYLIGPAIPKSDYNKIKTIIKKRKISQKVKFVGSVDRDDIPNYLSNAFALCLARPYSKQAEGGFPTKLGEYFAARRPVIVTKTGEIEKYVAHKKDAYLAEPNSIDDFYNKLLEMYNDNDKEIIAENGYNNAYGNFSSVKQGEKLLRFFMEYDENN